jgi:hypothetical protein
MRSSPPHVELNCLGYRRQNLKGGELEGRARGEASRRGLKVDYVAAPLLCVHRNPRQDIARTKAQVATPSAKRDRAMLALGFAAFLKAVHLPNGSFATWRTTMERTAAHVATDGAFQIRRPLDALNFFLADVRDGLGPYLAIYLLTVQKPALVWFYVRCYLGWSPRADACWRSCRCECEPSRQSWSAALAVTLASLLLPWLPTFWPVAFLQAAAHTAAAVFGPAVAAITLGVAGHKAFASRIGRNESFNHAGNAFAAAAAGIAAYVWGPVVVFFVLAAMSFASSSACFPSRAA